MISSPSGRRIFYLVPDFVRPSWGIALLYHHVRILRAHGFEAFILHRKTGFHLDWIEDRPPICYLEKGGPDIGRDDVLVIPEVLAAEAAAFDCRRVVFVQGAFLILKAFDRPLSYRELGFEAAMAILPHVQQILERHFDISARVVPPFIAEYFFTRSRTRRRRILLYPKKGYQDIGYVDFEILRKLLEPMLDRHSGWETVEVHNLPHREVARLAAESAFAVNLNCLEAFNTTVPEAMAAGCIPVCYQAFGGRDFLVDGVNAFVFPNNEVFRLAETLEDLMIHYDEREAELKEIRDAARKTAAVFTEGATTEALLNFFSSRVPPR